MKNPISKKGNISTVKLARLLFLLTTVAGIIIISFSIYGSHQLFSKHVLNIAESEAKTISKEFFNRFKYTILARNDDLEIVVNENVSEYLNLDSEIRDFLKDSRASPRLSRRAALCA